MGKIIPGHAVGQGWRQAHQGKSPRLSTESRTVGTQAQCQLRVLRAKPATGVCGFRSWGRTSMAKSLIFSGNVWTSLKASDTQMQAEWLLPLDTALSFQQKARHQPRVPSRLTSPITCAKLQSKAQGPRKGYPATP